MKKRNRKRKLTRSQKGISLIALTTTIFAAVNLKNTKILKGISIGKTDVSELTQEEADKYIAEYMNERFIYSKFGGKENFEKTIIERNKK